MKLTLQIFGHLMGRVDSLEKTLRLEKTEGRRIRARQRMRQLDGTTDSMDMNLSTTVIINQDLGIRDAQCYWRVLEILSLCL